MKLTTTLLPLAAISTAFVIPDEQITEQLILLSEEQAPSYFDKFQGSVDSVWSGVEETFKDAVAFSENAFDTAINAASEAKNTLECYMSMEKWDISSWLDSEIENIEDVDVFGGHHHKKPHHGRPGHGHHGHHGHKPNKTVYELIASSKYTTELAKLINKFPDLVEILNGTAANYTVFAPTNKAFEKIPKHGHEPSDELIKKVLAYHVSPDFYPAGRVLVSHTIPTALGEDKLGGEPQRLRVGLGLRGLAVNFYSRVVAVNIVCSPFSTATKPN
jgi:hypothetical protein